MKKAPTARSAKPRKGGNLATIVKAARELVLSVFLELALSADLVLIPGRSGRLKPARRRSKVR